MSSETYLQREYYERTAGSYDALHAVGDPEHNFALCCFSGLLDNIKCESVLDVGAGTGRAMLHLAQRHPSLKLRGVEPVENLRKVAYTKGINAEHLVDGDATKLPYPDGSFDAVCAFGILHHIAKPEIAVSEMLRVAKKAIFISDTNNYGQGGPAARALKRCLRRLGLWPLFNLVKTRGKGYMVSEDDGVYYSYSVFDNLRLVRTSCRTVHFIGTRNAGPNLYKTACHVGVLGLK